MHISDQGRNKLDPKSKKCTFIGYGEDEFGYRLWDDENKKMIRSRNVIFNERVMYKDRHSTSTNDSGLSEPVYVEMDDVPGSPTDESPQSEEFAESSIRQSSDTPVHPTLVPVLRRSSRPHAPNRLHVVN